MTSQRVPKQDEVERELSGRAEKVSGRGVESLISRREEVERKLERVPRSLRNMVKQIRLLFEMVRDYWGGHYARVPWSSVTMAVGALLYFVAPLDLLPDFMPGLGYVDDAMVIGLALKALQEDLRDYCEFKKYDPKTYFGDG